MTKSRPHIITRKKDQEGAHAPCWSCTLVGDSTSPTVSADAAEELLQGMGVGGRPSAWWSNNATCSSSAAFSTCIHGGSIRGVVYTQIYVRGCHRVNTSVGKNPSTHHPISNRTVRRSTAALNVSTSLKRSSRLPRGSEVASYGGCIIPIHPLMFKGTTPAAQQWLPHL